LEVALLELLPDTGFTHSERGLSTFERAKDSVGTDIVAATANAVALIASIGGVTLDSELTRQISLATGIDVESVQRIVESIAQSSVDEAELELPSNHTHAWDTVWRQGNAEVSLDTSSVTMLSDGFWSSWIRTQDGATPTRSVWKQVVIDCDERTTTTMASDVHDSDGTKTRQHVDEDDIDYCAADTACDAIVVRVCRVAGARWDRYADGFTLDRTSIHATDAGFSRVWTRKEDGHDSASTLWLVDCHDSARQALRSSLYDTSAVERCSGTSECSELVRSVCVP